MTSAIVLLLESDKASAPSFAPALEKRGYNLTIVHSATDAAAEINGTVPGVIVVDAASLKTSGTRMCRDLRKALMKRPEQFVETMTEKLMTYAMGRTVEYYDMPAVRKIVRDSARDNYRFSSIVMGATGTHSPSFSAVPLPQTSFSSATQSPFSSRVPGSQGSCTVAPSPQPEKPRTAIVIARTSFFSIFLSFPLPSKLYA